MHFIGMVVLAWTVHAALAQESVEDFERDLAIARRSMENQRWKAAEEKIRALLDKQRGAGHVLARRLELREMLEQCAFWQGHSEPDPANLIDGVLESWNPKTGEIELRYPKGLKMDWPEPDDGKEYPTIEAGDWRIENQVHFHPIAFKGSYEITLRGSGMLHVFLGYGGPDYYHLDLTSNPKLFHHVDGVNVFLGEGRKEVPESLSRSKDHELNIQVGNNWIRVLVGGEKLLAEKAPTPPFGMFAMGGEFEAWEILLTGETSGSWLNGLVDAANRKAFEEFRATYDAEAALPEWLRLTGGAEQNMDLEIPGRAREGQREAASRMRTLLEKGELRAGLDFARRLDAEAVGEEFRLWFEIHFLVALEEHELAFQRCEDLAALAPDHLPTQVLRAQAQASARGAESALETLRMLAAAHPGSSQVRAALARQYALSGRPEEARIELEAALAQGVDPRGLEEINGLVLRALNGPLWSQRSEYTSKHYLVATDMDRSLAFEAANELESAFAMYRRDLAQVSGTEARRFRVFLFSGEAGYKSFCQDLLGQEPEDTAGLYSPELEQLLIWNVPIRAQFIRTIRHEGLHQYLDRVMADPPRWLNEGLAEYYETVRLENGVSKDGDPHLDHMQLWRYPSVGWVPLEEFVAMSSAEFDRDTSLHYAEAWGLVHFLRRGEDPAPRLFQELIEQLSSGTLRKAALERVFAGVDFKDLERRFHDHVKGL